MPIPHRNWYVCHNCGEKTTSELPALAWIRKHPALTRITRSDCDNFAVKYNLERTLYIMFDWEMKAHCRELEGDDNNYMKMRDQYSRGLHRIWCHETGRKALLFHTGVHIWRLENNTPLDSAWAEWDGRRISNEMLVQILSCDRHPDYPYLPMQEAVRQLGKSRELTKTYEQTQLTLFAGSIP